MRKELKFLCFSDIHCHNHKSYSVSSINGKNTILEVSVGILTQVRKLAETLQIPNVVFAGDLFDSKNRVPVVVIEEVYKELLCWSEDGLNLFMIPGNHDLAVRSGNIHALELFSHISNITIVSEPEPIAWVVNKNQIVNVNAVPFREVMKDEWFIPEAEDKDRFNICIAHGLVSGSELRPDTFTDADKIAYGNSGKINFSSLQQFHFSAVGHIHYPQILGKKGNVLIPGQPWYQWPHEKIQQRGVWEVHLREDFVNCKLHRLNVPRFIEAIVEEDGTLVTDGTVKGNIVRLRAVNEVVSGDVLFEKREKIKKEESFFVEIISPLNRASVDSDKSVRLKLDPDASPKKVLAEVLRSPFVSLGGFSIEEIEEMGTEILEELLSSQEEQ